jgi:hypothetical protein
MKSLVKYIYYPPLSKHFLKNNLNNLNKPKKNVSNNLEKFEIKKEIKNTKYCNIWIRKNF